MAEGYQADLWHKAHEWSRVWRRWRNTWFSVALSCAYCYTPSVSRFHDTSLTLALILSSLRSKWIVYTVMASNWAVPIPLSDLIVTSTFSNRDITFLCFSWAFAKFRKATLSFVMSVRPPAWNISSPTGRIFMNFDIRNFFEELSEKFKVH